MSISEFFQGHNLYDFSKILLVTFFYSFPLGYGLTRIYWRDRNSFSRILIGSGMGLPVTALLWSLMVWLSIPFAPSLFIGVTCIAGLCLFLISAKTSHPIEREKRPAKEIYSHIGLIIIFAAFSFLSATIPLINLKIPPVLDGQLHGFIQMFLKYTGIYHPLSIYPGKPPLPNFYPPGFHVICTMNSMLTGISLTKTMMGTAVAAYVVLCLFLFEVLYSLTSRLWIASIGVFSLSCRGMINLLVSSQYPKILAMTACVGFFFVFSQVLERKDWKNVFLAGLLLGATGVIHTLPFFWLATALVLYMLSRYLAKPGPSLCDQADLALILVLGFLANLPQFFINSEKLVTSSQKIYTHYLLSIKANLAQYQGWPFIFFTIISLIIFSIKRDRKSVFLITWIGVILVNIDYWRILKLLSPAWFSITPHVAPIRGVWSVYTDIFFFGNTQAAILFGFFPVIPIAVAMGAYTATKTDFLSGFATRLKKNPFPPLALTIILGTGFVYYEKKHTDDPLIALADPDIFVLEQLKKNSVFHEVLIFNPPNYSSFWAPVIAERRALLFRNTFEFSYKNPPYPRKKMGEIYFNLKQHYGFLKENKITHIYVPSFLKNTFEKNRVLGFLKLEFSAEDAAVYRVL